LKIELVSYLEDGGELLRKFSTSLHGFTSEKYLLSDMIFERHILVSVISKMFIFAVTQRLVHKCYIIIIIIIYFKLAFYYLVASQRISSNRVRGRPTFLPQFK
jgi:hypothetical protein